MAIWRGTTNPFTFRFIFKSEILTLKELATTFWIESMEINSSFGLMMFFKTSFATWMSIAVFVKEEKAPIRIRQPSKTLILESICDARKKATSLETGIFSVSAFFFRMATFVSISGGWISAIKPHSKRDRRRSSKFGMSFGNLSLVTTICFLAS